MAYTAVVLTEESREKLLADYINQPAWWPSASCTPEHIIRCHHMTCDMKPAAKSIAVEFIGRLVALEVVRWGMLLAAPPGNPDFKVLAVAVEVKCCVPSKNPIKHITLYHHESVTPVKSNDITEWGAEFKTPYILTGVVQEVASGPTVAERGTINV
jgi:hypothetical protein